MQQRNQVIKTCLGRIELRSMPSPILVTASSWHCENYDLSKKSCSKMFRNQWNIHVSWTARWNNTFFKIDDACKCHAWCSKKKQGHKQDGSASFCHTASFCGPVSLVVIMAGSACGWMQGAFRAMRSKDWPWTPPSSDHLHILFESTRRRCGNVSVLVHSM